MILPSQYTTLVKPAFEEFCLPTKKYADVIVPRGAENTVAIDLISQHMQVRKLESGFIVTEIYPGHYLEKQWIPGGVPDRVFREPVQWSLVIQVFVQVRVQLEHQLDFKRSCQFKPGLQDQPIRYILRK